MLNIIFRIFKIYVHQFMKLGCIVLTLSLLVDKLSASVFSESSSSPWGADAELVGICKDKEKKTSNVCVQSAGQKCCRAMIHFFQNYISPIDGPRSSFYPTSSQYALEAIQKHGVFKGIALGCDRLMRENGEPWVYETIEKHGVSRKHDPVR